MSDSFKFGRGYTWIRVNLDYLSLYPNTDQIGMLPSGHEIWSQRVVNMQRNNERDTIVLTRRDLARNKRTIIRGVIDLNDFTEQSITRQEYARASIVLFMDDDGNTKTLKNRYGRTN